MRILLVHDRIGDLGGAEANVRIVAEGLARRGHEVALLHGQGTGQGEERFHRVFAQRFDWTGGAGAAWAAARAWAPEVVYVHKLARLDLLNDLVCSQLPLVRMVHDHDMWCQRSSRYFPWSRTACTRTAGWGCAMTCSVVRGSGPLGIKLAWPGLKLRELELCRRFDRHITVTGFMRDELVRHGIDATTVSILPPVPRPAPDGFQADHAGRTILYVGQLLRGKGVDFLLRACARLTQPDWRLVVIGDGSHRAACASLASSLGIAGRVEFTGWVQQEELHRFYAHARCAVVPSVWPEPIATIGLELMHHALPVVGFDSGGMADWLDDGKVGYLVPPRDVAAMAGRIDRLLGDRGLAARLGAEGLARARAGLVVERYYDEVAAILTACARARAA